MTSSLQQRKLPHATNTVTSSSNTTSNNNSASNKNLAITSQQSPIVAK